MCRRNRISSDQWILRHILRFQLRLTPHHTRRACLYRSLRNGRLICRRTFRPAARSLPWWCCWTLVRLLPSATAGMEPWSTMCVWPGRLRLYHLWEWSCVVCLCVRMLPHKPADDSVINVWHQYYYRTSLPHASQLSAIGHFQVFFALAYQNSDPIQPFIDLRKPGVCIYHTTFFEFIPYRYLAPRTI